MDEVTFWRSLAFTFVISFCIAMAMWRYWHKAYTDLKSDPVVVLKAKCTYQELSYRIVNLAEYSGLDNNEILSAFMVGVGYHMKEGAHEKIVAKNAIGETMTVCIEKEKDHG
jgi:hypothetical protein